LAGGRAIALRLRSVHEALDEMMWGCVAIIGGVAVLAIAGANLAYALFALPRVLMMGAMMWMMTRGMGSGSGGSGQGGA
jgi:hypothetical protein